MMLLAVILSISILALPCLIIFNYKKLPKKYLLEDLNMP